MGLREDALKLHKDHAGKIAVVGKVCVKDRIDLSLAYSPGVAEPCREIHQDPEQVYTYTFKGNMVAIVTDGTAVLGLGDIGPEAALPVMEGKALLFKDFGGVDAFPICLKTQDAEEIIKTVALLEPVFGGINLEDISAPRCFEIENRLKELLDIPVFHDDQHGTAIILLAALMNGAKVVGKALQDLVVVVNGAGSAGIAITKIMLRAGVKDVILADKDGLIGQNSPGLNWAQKEIATVTNKSDKVGSLADGLAGADVFIGVSAGNLVTEAMVRAMNAKPIVFAMANPVPEIMPDLAKQAGAAVVGTGRSDFPNQINNVLAFPGVFRGALDVRAKAINEEMKLAAAQALANLVSPAELTADYIIPQPFDPRIKDAVAKAVAQTAIATGVARLKP